MKPTIFGIFAVLATLTSAQSGIQNLPGCAKDCVSAFTAGEDIGDCKASDAPCICKSDSFLSGIACCLVGKCNTEDQQKATDFAHQFCALSGVTDLPASVSCTSTAASTPPATSPPSTSSTGTGAPSSASTSPTANAANTASSTSTPNSAPTQNVMGIGAGIMCAGMLAMI